MPRDGTGTYNLPNAAVATSTPISAADENATRADIAAALTASIARDGQTLPSANLPMNTYKHTNVGSATARNEYATLGQVQDAAAVWGGTAGGTANALTLALSPAIAAYTAGMTIRFISSAANTGAATVNVNGVGAVAINKGDGSVALASGDIPSGHIVTITHDGTRFVLVGVVSAFGATLSVAATAAAGRATLGASANPTTSPGAPGAIQALNSGSGSQLEAPAGGGVWICWWLGYSTTTYTLVSIFEVAEVAGGTLLKAGAANIAYIGIAFRKS